MSKSNDKKVAPAKETEKMDALTKLLLRAKANREADLRAKEKEGYEVGYGKPPRKNQFKKGQVANPKGRPKNMPKSFERLIYESLDKKMRVAVGGNISNTTIREALVLKAMQMGLSGNLKVLNMIMEISKKGDAKRAEGIAPQSSLEQVHEMLYTLFSPALNSVGYEFPPIKEGTYRNGALKPKDEWELNSFKKKKDDDF